MVDSLTTWHLTTVEDTDFKSELQIYGFKMADRIWQLVMQKLLHFDETRYTRKFKIIDYESEVCCGKRDTSDRFETSYIYVFWLADYQYDRENWRNWHIQGQN